MKLIKIVPYIIFTIILAAAFYLRSSGSSTIPYPGESMDEYSFAWVGLSLIEVGTPIATSGIPGYKNTDFRYINVDQVFRGSAKGNPFPINYPWFDHPPLMGLIIGGYAYLNGARVFEDTLISFIRKPMIIFGTVSVLLLFILVRKIFGLKEALAASIIYATSPLAIISGRMVQAENLLIPLFLISLIALYFFIEKKKTWLLYLAGIIAGISLLVKLSGLAIILSCIFLILYFSPGGIKRAIPSVIIFLVVSLSFLIFFISYGAAYDINQFFTILISNSSRTYSVGPQAFFDLLTTTRITALKYFTDGFILSGWLAAILLFVIPAEQRKKEMFVLVPLVCYLIIFLLFGSEPYGWYRFPFLPFLFAAIARILVLTFKNPSLAIPSLLILLLPIGINLSKIISIENFQHFAGFWRWGLTGIAMLLLSVYLKPVSKFTKIIIPIVLLCLFILAIYLNLEYFWKITPEYWQSAT